MLIPSNPLSETSVFDTQSWLRVEEFRAKKMPSSKFLITLSRMVTPEGTSARPAGSAPSLLHETVAVRERVNGPERHLVRRSGLVAFGGRADLARTFQIGRS